MENKWENEIEMKTRFFLSNFFFFHSFVASAMHSRCSPVCEQKKKIFRVEVWRVIIMKSEYWLYLMVNHKLYI